VSKHPDPDLQFPFMLSPCRDSGWVSKRDPDRDRDPDRELARARAALNGRSAAVRIAASWVPFLD
jgi:hypothetical protein